MDSGDSLADILADPLAGRSSKGGKKKKRSGLAEPPGLDKGEKSARGAEKRFFFDGPEPQEEEAPPLRLSQSGGVPVDSTTGRERNMSVERQAFELEKERRRAKQNSKMLTTSASGPLAGYSSPQPQQPPRTGRSGLTVEIPPGSPAPAMPGLSPVVGPLQTVPLPSPGMPRLVRRERQLQGGGSFELDPDRSRQQINPEKQFQKREHHNVADRLDRTQPLTPTTEPISRRHPEMGGTLSPKRLEAYLEDAEVPAEDALAPTTVQSMGAEDLMQVTTAMSHKQHRAVVAASRPRRSVSTKTVTDLDGSGGGATPPGDVPYDPSTPDARRIPRPGAPAGPARAGHELPGATIPDNTGPSRGKSAKKRQLKQMNAPDSYSSYDYDSLDSPMLQQAMRDRHHVEAGPHSRVSEREEAMKLRERELQQKEDQLRHVEEKLRAKAANIRRVKQTLEEKHAEQVRREEELDKRQKALEAGGNDAGAAGDQERGDRKRSSSKSKPDNAGRSGGAARDAELSRANEKIDNLERKLKEMEEMIKTKSDLITARDEFLAVQVAE
eukprot:CAMPEP_0119139872 /NCGR_PEP_ID=MMETSP1310-20130426/28278_1 /TAXON_ID=464262 /ORGANISM="Genus nov. species nov., Strain RCC2339" /LENGTH=553 /DNA_ID=CAMNT_0007131197 /DNA_START=38 /DNA_END=1696 /DNA_ORIENTATION=+